NILRVGATNNTVSVHYDTHDGTAVANTNYTPTSGTMSFTAGQSLGTVVIPLVNDPRVTGDLFFTMALSNPSAGTQVTQPGTNVIILQDADAGLSFTTNASTVLRNAGSALI